MSVPEGMQHEVLGQFRGIPRPRGMLVKHRSRKRRPPRRFRLFGNPLILLFRGFADANAVKAEFAPSDAAALVDRHHSPSTVSPSASSRRVFGTMNACPQDLQSSRISSLSKSASVQATILPQRGHGPLSGPMGFKFSSIVYFVSITVRRQEPSVFTEPPRGKPPPQSGFS